MQRDWTFTKMPIDEQLQNLQPISVIGGSVWSERGPSAIVISREQSPHFQLIYYLLS